MSCFLSGSFLSIFNLKNKKLFKTQALCDCLPLHRGSTAEKAAQDIISVQIPALMKLCQSGDLSINNVDVFCEKGVFDTDTSRRILKAGKDAGWKINFHGDEINPMNSGEVSADLCESFCGVVVTTCVSHAQGPRFDSRKKLYCISFNEWKFIFRSSLCVSVMHLLSVKMSGVNIGNIYIYIHI